MAKRRIRTDLLLATTALLLLVLWFALGSHFTPLDENAALPFSALEEHPPKTLTVMGNDSSITIKLAEDPNAEQRFLVQGTEAVPADEAAIDRLIRAIASLEVLRDVPEPRDLTSLGLLTPTLRLTFALNDKPITLSLGRNSQAPDTGKYALVSGNGKPRVVVLTPTTAAALEVSPQQLVEHRLVDWLPSEVRRVTLSRSFSRIALVQLENGHFELADAPQRRARRTESEALLLALTNLTVERYVDERNTANLMGSTPLTVLLESNSDRNPAPLTLYFGGTCPNDPTTVLVSLAGPVARTGCVKHQILEAFPSAETELVDDRLFFLHTDEAEKLTVESPGNRLVLERRGAAFQLLEPEPQEVSLDAGNAILSSLVAVHGKTLGRCHAQLANPTLKLTLRSGIVGKKSFSDETLLVGPALPSGERHVCRDDGQMLLVSREQSSALIVEPSLLRSPQLLNLPYDSIDEVAITSPQGVERLKTNEQGHLTLVYPKLPGDTASIESLTERLAQLTAERWLTKSALLALRNERLLTVVKFWVKTEKGERVEHQLRLLFDPESVNVAQLDGDEAPFVLSGATAALFDGLLVDKSAYRLTEGDRAFSLSRSTEQIRCERTPRGFVCPSHQLPETTITQLTETLTQLRATTVTTGKLKPRADMLVLRVYGPEPSTASPRFTLTLNAPAKEDSRRRWTASGDFPRLLVSYNEENIEPLLHLFKP